MLAFAVIAILAPGNLAPGQLEWSRFGGVLLLLAVLGILAYRKWGSKP